MYSTILTAVLFGVWLLWSGHYTPLLVGLGAVSALAVVGLVRRMDGIDHESVPIHVTWQAALYLPWLAWQIVKSNIDVARRILHPALPISPRVLRAPVELRSDLCRAIYANSITLTPGTVSIELEPGEVTVHALSEEAAADVLAGEMHRRVRRVEGDR